MPKETPFEFYLRARHSFNKSGDIEDAAEVYLSVLNLSRHGLSAATTHSVNSAFLMLKNELGPGFRGTETTQVARISGAGQAQIEIEQEELERKKRARLIASKEGDSWRKHTDAGHTHKKLVPFWEHRGGEDESDLRALYARISTESSLASGREDKGTVESMINALYSYRPWSDDRGTVRGPTRETITDHPMEDIPLFKEQGFYSYFRDIYDPDSENHVSHSDLGMRSWEGRHANGPQHHFVGSFGSGSVGQDDMFRYGFDAWKKDCKKHGLESVGDEKDFIEHMILRAEGVPEEIIFKNFYNEDGSNKGEDMARTLLTGKREEQMGLLPYLLGLEALPLQESRDILHWFADGDHDSNPPGNFFKNHANTFPDGNGRGLLNRVFRKRLGAMARQFMDPIIQSRKQQGADYNNERVGSDEDEFETDLLTRALSLSRASAEGGWLDPKDNQTIYDRISDDRGMIPGPDGAYSDVMPIVSEALLDSWVNADGVSFTEKQKEKVMKLGERLRKKVKESREMDDWSGAYDTGSTPEGDVAFSGATYEHCSGEGGHSASGQDLLLWFHDMFGGLFTDIPKFEQPFWGTDNRAPVARPVEFPGEGSMDYKDMFERLKSKGGAARELYDIHQGVKPLLGDMSGPELSASNPLGGGDSPYAEEEIGFGPGRGGEEEVTGRINFKNWLGSLLTADRDRFSEEGSVGTIHSTGNAANSVSWYPDKANEIGEHHGSKIGDKRKLRTLLGDMGHVTDDELRRLRVGQASFSVGNSQAHEPQNELAPEPLAQLIDLAIGMSHNHGESHPFFDDFIDGHGTSFIDSLLADKDNRVASPLHGIDYQVDEETGLPIDDTTKGIPLRHLLEILGLVRYVNEDKSFGPEKISNSPLDNAEGSFAIYRHREHRDEDSKLHGLEPNTMDNLAHRMAAFRALPESARVPLVHPHELVHNASGRHMVGSPGELRDYFRRHKNEPESGSPSFHRQWLDRGYSKEDQALLLDQARAADSDGERRPQGHFIDFDRWPILDPNREQGIGEPEMSRGFNDHIGGKYSEEFPHYLITSGSLQNVLRRIGAASGVSGGPEGLQALGGPDEADSEGRSYKKSGFVIGPNPIEIMKRHIEELRDLRQELQEKGEDVAVKRVTQAIKEQQSIMVDYAHGPDSGLTEDSGEQEYARGKNSALSRWIYDSLMQTGVTAQALKKHYIAQDPTLADKFGKDAEGYVNHQALLHAAERLNLSAVHTGDDSWREELAQSMRDLGDDALATKIEKPVTEQHWVSPTVVEKKASPSHFENMNAAFASGEAAEVPGFTILRHYIENDDSLSDDHRKDALAALDHISDNFDSKQEFLDSFHDHARNIHTDIDGKREVMSKKDWLALDPAERGKVVGYNQLPRSTIRDNYIALMTAAKGFNQDSKITGMLENTNKSAKGHLSVPDKVGRGGNKAQKNYNKYQQLGALWDNWRKRNVAPGSSFTLENRDNMTSLPVRKDGFHPLSMFSSRGLRRKYGTPSRPSIAFTHHIGGRRTKIPNILDASWRAEKGGSSPDDSPHPDSSNTINILHIAHNALTHAMGGSVPDYSHSAENGTPLENTDGYMYWDSDGTVRSAAHEAGQQSSGGGSLADISPFSLSLDVFTDVDLLLKKRVDPPPVKPMHRIFNLDDLEYLRGFSGDWVVSSWPRGERLIVKKKGKTVIAKNSDGDEVDLPNKVENGLRKAYDKSYTIDTIWDGDILLIVDILKSGDEDMETMVTKDRNRHLRANFEATEEVLIPAPINTKRTDEEGLEKVVKELMGEPGTKQVLLRDAEATYMKGENRHPKWVLLTPEQQLDVLVVSSSDNSHCLGVGPILEEVAKKIGNRSLEYEGENYMDVGSMSSSSLEEGQYVTVGVSGVSHTTRKGEPVYRLNAPKYLRDSESGATDSLTTLKILASSLEVNSPHKVRVSKGNIHVVLPTGRVIYNTEPYENGFIMKDVDYPDEYLLRLSESQRDYWSPLAAVLLKQEKEAVVPEPPANHEKKPKKVIPKKDLIMKDPELVKGLVKILEAIDDILKEKVTFTGSKGLGFDYGTGVQSPQGPTKNTEGYNLPDFDAAARQEDSNDCWCGAGAGEMCEQGRGHSMEDCPIAHPPEKEETPHHITISRNSHKDSSV